MMRMITPSFFSHRQYISLTSTSVHAQTWEMTERGSGRMRCNVTLVRYRRGIGRVGSILESGLLELKV